MGLPKDKSLCPVKHMYLMDSPYTDSHTDCFVVQVKELPPTPHPPHTPVLVLLGDRE